MTKQEAYELGAELARKWLLSGYVQGRSLAGKAKAAEAVLCRSAGRVGEENSPLSGREWLIERECAAVVSAFSPCGALPALRREGRSARLELLGESLAGTEALQERSLLVACLEGVQSVQTLTEKELSLLMPALQLGILLAMEHSVSDTDRLEQLLTALEGLQTLDLRGLSEELSAVHQIFASDAIYLQMDEESRACCRRRLAQMARKQQKTEPELASELMEQCTQTGKHIGFLLFPDKQGSGIWYPATIVGISILGALGIGLLAGCLWCAALLVLPLSQIVVSLLDFILLRTTPRRPILRLDLPNGLPAEGRTLVVIAAIVPSMQEADSLANHLELAYLANRGAGEEVRYGVLADLPDSRTPPDAPEKQPIAHLNKALEKLNQKYGEYFCLFYREPAYQPGDECYRGHERKRGALMDLIALLTGRYTELRLLCGDETWLRHVRFLLTLDSDTRLNMDSVRRLVGAMLHPLNRPEVDPARRIVVRGYGLLQPRIGCALSDVQATRFAGLYGGLGGVDPYMAGTSDLYHDVFQATSYNGKGLLDVHAAAVCLTGRFPENRVLSHDLLEGAFLRAGLAGDTELTDGFPRSVAAFLRRQHRWTRGDWQAAGWMLPTIRLQNGQKVKNPLRLMDRWKLLDNLRRSLLPIAVQIALLAGVCLWHRGAFWTGLLAALALSMASLCAALELLLSRGRGGHQRFHARITVGLGRELLCVPVRLLLLPREAWTNLSAICTALYRLLISHKKLLEWVPSASSGERKKTRLWLPLVIVGLFTLIFAVSPGGKLLGLGWCLTPLLVKWLDAAPPEEKPLGEEERTFLLHQGELMWRYFTENITKEHNYLPPDNVQELPAVGAAPRTSPTNIGLALLCCLAAIDLKLTSREEALNLLEHMLTAVEKLEKDRGHLYNWYDTTTAQPLYPRYISTVDSGNLCAALLALEQGLRTLGEEKMAQQAAALAGEMHFGFLYDWKRDLFHIGWDVEQGQYTPSWYDLLASEARETSYLAVARNEVPPRHWRTLSRAHVTVGNYSGLASWTGTAFEYFMPHLLLPARKGTLIYEALAFCAAVQRQWGKALGIPWGVSESGFYALNNSQSYRYKAHGVPALALSHGLEREQVVTPYASFLTLRVLPHASVENLKELRRLGMEGRYGLYEAMDFTPRRTAGQSLSVRSWMVHHLGMSLLAIDNALNEQIMVRRFLDNQEMAAAEELLEERVQTGVPVLRRKRKPAMRRKEMKQTVYERSGTGFLPAMPECHLLSEGEERMLLFASGEGWQERGKLLLLAPIRSEIETDGMLRTCFPTEEVGKELTWRFTGHDGSLTLKTPEGTLCQTIALRECGVLYTFTLTACTNAKLHLCVIPVLDTPDQYEAHRAFSQLGLEWEALTNGVTFRRRENKGKKFPTLALQWDENAPAADISEDGIIHLTLSAQESVSFHLACASGEGQTARRAAQALLLGMHQEAPVSFDRIAARYHLTGQEIHDLDEILSCLRMPRLSAVPAPGQAALWPFGISGDDPIWLVEGDQRRALELPMRQWQALRELGTSLDLVFLVPEQKEPCFRDWLSELTEPGGHAGVHLVTDSPHAREVLRSMARLTGRVESGPKPVPELPLPVPRPVLGPEERTFQWEDMRFTFQVCGKLQNRRWTHVLANPEFGYLADECGTGHLWYHNSRENKLTPWLNDPYALRGAEELAIVDGVETFALFAREDGARTKVTYGPGWARWERQKGMQKTCLTAVVPPERPCRWLFLETEGFSGEARLRWTMHPQLSDRRSGQYFVTAERTEGGLYLENAANTRFPEQRLYLQSPMGQPEVVYTLSSGVELTLPLTEGLSLYAGMEGAKSGESRDALMVKTEAWWKKNASPVRLESPNAALDHYLNFWCRYQVIACRLFARCGLYQCGGAYGFRDQLQDAINLLPFTPEFARQQILRCCAHQYSQGDVQHWWHPTTREGTESGVRTRISDDLLWLPWGVCRYVEVTGNRGILEESTGFLQSETLKKEEEARFEQAVETGEKASVFDHCVRALECVLGRGVGEHGLCLMGTGDWNDGMDRMGREGKGESVWLTWFLSMILRDFAPLCQTRRRQRFEELSKSLAQAADRAWDGGWYRRAYTDSGEAVGSTHSAECKIDSIAQSFAVFAPNPAPERGTQAVRAAIENLYNEWDQTIALLAPAFDGRMDAGYISAYPPGVRENGGQYTHAAVWLAMAALRIGEVDKGYAMLQDLLPERHNVHIWQGEPYVLCGDVSTAPGREGRAGWSWYTGAAGWYGRVVLEELLGLQVRSGVLHLEPKLPHCWPGCKVDWRWGQAVFHITIQRGVKSEVLFNGAAAPYGIFLNELEGEQEIIVTLGVKES